MPTPLPAQRITTLTTLQRSPQEERKRVAQYQARSDVLRYEFEELKIAKSDAAEVLGLLSGSAQIHFYDDEDGWSIGEIRVMRSDAEGAPVDLDRGSWLYHAVYDALENEASWNANICDAVRAKVEG
jgi:hypothetical protein